MYKFAEYEYDRMLTAEALLQRWPGCTEDELKVYVEDEILQAYIIREKRRDKIHGIIYYWATIADKTEIMSALFEKVNVKQVELAYPEVLDEILEPVAGEGGTGVDTMQPKPRRSTRHRQEIQRIAADIWQQNPKATQEEVAASDKIHSFLAAKDKTYSEKTLLLWVRDVDPRPKVGRRGRPRGT